MTATPAESEPAAVTPGDSSPRRRLWPRLLLLVVIVAVVAAAGSRWGHLLSLSALAERESELLGYGRDHAAATLVGLFVLYVAVTASSFPGATVLTLLSGWLLHRLFGDVIGYLAALVLVSFASTTGATLAFLMSRYLLRDALRKRYAGRLERFDAALERDGPFYLFSLRLTPAVPFFLVNLLMGLTPIAAATFWWVSQLGMLPGTCVFVFAGHQVPSLAELQRRGTWDILWPGPLIALLLLAAFPWVARWVMAKVRGEAAAAG